MTTQPPPYEPFTYAPSTECEFCDEPGSRIEPLRWRAALNGDRLLSHKVCWEYELAEYEAQQRGEVVR